MELTETIDGINRQLIHEYGIDTITGQAMWRVVWSMDQFEHRLGTYSDYTPEGIYLRTVTEVRWVPKYRQWIKEKYVLERLVLVPIVNEKDLPASKMSYEPMFPFQDDDGNYKPPTLDGCKFVIITVLAAQGKKTFKQYKAPDEGLNKEELIALKSEEINKLSQELFGNETDTGDALAHKEAIVVPRSYEREN